MCTRVFLEKCPGDTQRLAKAWAGSLLTPGQKSESARLGFRKKKVLRAGAAPELPCGCGEDKVSRNS